MAGGLESTIRNWQREGLGIVAVTLLVEDPDGDRATLAGVRQWRREHDLRSAYILADPKPAMVEGGGVYRTPLFTIVDPRTMRVIDRSSGWSGRHPDELLALARRNRP